MGRISIKRVYEPPEAGDGYRVLVDRLWPRGMKKADAKLDLWLKDVAPSAGLRRWFGHDPERWPEFRRRYRAELSGNTATKELRSIARAHKVLTLLYGAKSPDFNQAVVLLEVLQRKPAPRRTRS